MVLTMDIGNSNISMGLYEKSDLKYHWRIKTDPDKTADEYAMILKNLFDFGNISIEDIDGIIISSVVPPIMYTIQEMCKKYFQITPMVIGPGIKTGLNIKYDNPKEVGADRIVNAVAGIKLYGAPLIVVDFGTATTYCYINENKEYVGGAIAPGIGISTEALYTRASKLPRIEITKAQHVIGKNTVHAMQSGVFYGYVGQVEGIVKRMKKLSKERPTVIATGALAELITEESTEIDMMDSFLTLKGLQIIYEKNKG
ncbi:MULTISPECIES: type III pantothenate kinase [Bacillaceae]|uniref:Type III pantothenate kinase n=1 Tax=Evansella alkalicola TaxID=745819 RepID=A0ABS6JTW7_9BACI|nr:MULTISPECIES: type III pantothenate kinase [Bacillaceae]MBU9722015.1 type III pantothenate kinase [Bacillus alkalicola]